MAMFGLPAQLLPGLAGELHVLHEVGRGELQGAEGELPRRAQLLTLVSSLMKSMFPGKYLSGNIPTEGVEKSCADEEHVPTDAVGTTDLIHIA